MMITTNMANEVDMYYRFTSEEEPSDEQLACLMREVCDEVRKENAASQAEIYKNILREYEKVKKMFPNL
jgi:hypothetical protein